MPVVPCLVEAKQAKTGAVYGCMAGHRYVSSTEKYLMNQTEDLLADIDMYHPL